MTEKPDQDGQVAGGTMEERLETLYLMAENYCAVDSSEVNPSFHALKQVTDRYIAPTLIAEGGLKQIFRVRDARSQRDLAMASLRDDASDDLYDPFIHEAWLTARLDHPNIITIHDVGVAADGRPYFTMDLKSGYSLYELILELRSGDRKLQSRYPLSALLGIFLKVCDAVSYAHSVKVVHLDLKPANIQIGEYGQVLVCDWGLGRVVEGGDDPQEIDRKLFNPDLLGSVNLYGQIKGTPGYMAPEQLLEAGPVNTRSDVYGLGCILYSLLTLQRPLSGEDEEVMKQTLAGSIVPPIERTPDRNIPDSLNAVVMKAIAVKPSRRYASVDMLREEVRRYLTGFATEAEHAGLFRQMSLFYRRNRLFCITVAGLVLLIVAETYTAFHKVSDARNTAEDTLALYEAGRDELEKVSLERTESVADLARRYQFQSDHARAEAILLTALRKDPGNKQLMRALGEHYFMLQEFNKAVPYLAGGENPNDEVEEAARRCASVKTDEQRLDTPQVIDVLQRLQIHEPLSTLLVLYDQRNRFELDQRAEIINAYLHIINPGWNNGWFEYDSTESRLRLGGKGLKRVSTQQSVLLGLNPRYLDLSGSEVDQLWIETRLASEVLDIRGTPMKNTWFLKRFVHLRKLIMTPGQLSDDMLNQLTEKVVVVEKPLD
jgi:serine/threonine-protein kinase